MCKRFVSLDVVVVAVVVAVKACKKMLVSLVVVGCCKYVLIV